MLYDSQNEAHPFPYRTPQVSPRFKAWESCEMPEMRGKNTAAHGLPKLWVL